MHFNIIHIVWVCNLIDRSFDFYEEKETATFLKTLLIKIKSKHFPPCEENFLKSTSRSMPPSLPPRLTPAPPYKESDIGKQY